MNEKIEFSVLDIDEGKSSEAKGCLDKDAAEAVMKELKPKGCDINNVYIEKPNGVCDINVTFHFLEYEKMEELCRISGLERISEEDAIIKTTNTAMTADLKNGCYIKFGQPSIIKGVYITDALDAKPDKFCIELIGESNERECIVANSESECSPRDGYWHFPTRGRTAKGVYEIKLSELDEGKDWRIRLVYEYEA